MFSASELMLLPVILLEIAAALYVAWLLVRFVRAGERAARALEEMAAHRRPPASG